MISFQLLNILAFASIGCTKLVNGLKVQTFSYNMAHPTQKTCDEQLTSLASKVKETTDVVAFALQESLINKNEDETSKEKLWGARKMKNYVKEYFSRKLKKLKLKFAKSSTLGGLFTKGTMVLVFVKEELTIENDKDRSEGFSAFGRLKRNKGIAMVKMTIDGIPLAFAGIHASSNNNNDCKKDIVKGRKYVDKFTKKHNVFWMGDFNPRFAVNNQELKFATQPGRKYISQMIQLKSKLIADSIESKIEADYIESKIEAYERDTEKKEITKPANKKSEKFIIKTLRSIYDDKNRSQDARAAHYKKILEKCCFLKTQMKRMGFDEESIAFPPTYHVGKSITDKLNPDIYEEDNKKGNVPSWTDRIFFKLINNYNIETYEGLFDVKGSDHKPVMGIFTLTKETRIVDRRCLASTSMQRLLEAIQN